MQLRACRVDLGQGVVWRDGMKVGLTDLERRLLQYLAERSGQEVPKKELLTEVWGYRSSVSTRAVEATLHRLRAKIERDPSHPEHLTTVRHRGLRFLAPHHDPAPSAKAGLLPWPLRNRFFGRQALLGRIVDTFATERLISLVGVGGIGKTRLAEEALLQAERGAVWVDAASADVSDDLGALVGAALQVDASTEDLERVILAELARRPSVWLVLDNLETMTASAAACLPRWLARAPSLRVLVTSREPLSVAGERVLSVGPLERGAARALFRDRMRSTPTEAADIESQILERLDGIPLAIELASRLTSVLTLGELLERLGRTIDLLCRQDTASRHGSLRATIASSVDALPEGPRACLVTLSVFEEPVAIADVEALYDGDLVTALQALGDRSLLRREEGRIRLLHPVRAYAAGLLEASGQGEAFRIRLMHQLAECAQQVFGDGLWSNLTHARPWVRDRFSDLRAAWRLAGSRAPALAPWLALPLYVHHAAVGPFEAGVQVLESTLALPLSSSLRARVLGWLAHARCTQFDSEVAETLAFEALSLAEETGDLETEAEACAAMTKALLYRVDAPFDAWAERAARAFDQLGELASTAAVLELASHRASFVGRVEASIDALGDAIRLRRRAGDRIGSAQCLVWQAFFLLSQGQPSRAARAAGTALNIYVEYGHDFGVWQSRHLLGMTSLYQGDVALARSELRFAAELCERVGGRLWRQGTLWTHLALAEALGGYIPGAQEALRKALSVVDELEAPTALQDWLWAWTELLAGRTAAAQELLVAPPKGYDDLEEFVSGLVRALVYVGLARAGRLPQGTAMARPILDAAPRLQVQQRPSLAAAVLHRALAEALGPPEAE